MSDTVKSILSSPWINRGLIVALIWFVQETYSSIRADIAELQKDVSQIKSDVNTTKREIELLEHFNLSPK